MEDRERRTVSWDIGIVADDLTGANDTAVHFAHRGWDTHLQLGDVPDAGPTAAPDTAAALVVTTDARALPDADAETITRNAVERLAGIGTRHLYVKIDSTMRGSVAAQVDGAVRGWNERHGGAFAVVCSAYPVMGRTVENGRVLVHGSPLEQSPAGQDPVSPVKTGELARLLPHSSHVDIPTRGNLDGSARTLASALTSQAAVSSIVSAPVILTVDAATEADLTTIARAIDLLGDKVVPVGSAGLALAMAGVWSKAAQADVLRSPALAANRILVLITSQNQVARQQGEHLGQALAGKDALVLRPSLTAVLDPEGLRSWSTERVPSGENLPGIVAVIAPSERADSSRAGAATTIADNLAELTSQLLEHGDFEALLVVGGDGARALLGKLGATGMRILDQISDGVPFGRIVGGPMDDLPIITKAGGFGSPDVLTSVVELLRSRRQSHERTVPGVRR
jgi:D-threonate/D-erythronate kinase